MKPETKERLVPPCPKCESAAVRKRGTDTASGGVRLQVWHCRDCGHIYRTPIDEELAQAKGESDADKKQS